MTKTDLRYSIEAAGRYINKEISMVSREEKQIERNKKAREEYDQWRDVSQAHWSHWRAWGSWFSWGSPVGLGLFVVLLAFAFAVVKFAITL
jgi:hypothetical protein